MIGTVIAKWTGRSFGYGAADCCQFVGECVEAATGKNPMQSFEYANESEAYSIINEYGDLEAAITATVGAPYQGFKDGDICLVESTDGEQIAGVAWHDRVVVRAKRDLMDLPRAAAKVVWKT